MRIIMSWITLTALLQQFAAQELQGKDLGNDFEITDEPDLEPFHRCFGCDPCTDYDDGKKENGKGTRVCSTEPNELDGCVSMYMSRLIRKCISDMNMEDTVYCKKNHGLCVRCYGPDCNVHNFTANVGLTDGSAALRTSLLILSTCLISWLVMSE